VYPNPASSEVTIYSSNEMMLSMKNFYGRTLKRVALSEGDNVILLDGISNGMYILEFENGHAEIFVKQ